MIRNVSRCISYIVSNWRIKVKLIAVGFLLMVILKQYFDIQSLHNQQVAIKVETRSASAVIHSVSEKLKAGNQSEPNLSREILALDNAALLLGQPPGDGGHGQDRAIVCPEHHMSRIDWPYNLRNWVIEDCDYGRKVGDLLTLVFSVDKEEQIDQVAQSWHESYNGQHVIVETSHEVVTQVKAKNVKVVRKGETMRDILELVSTEFVLLADDLDVVTNWTNIERGIRLLSSGWMGVSAVGGAVRNSSGHWHIGCTQAEISYYRLELRPGYRQQYSDCMVCDHVGGPVILRRDSLLPDSPRSLATLDTALTSRRPMLACPDMMFLTRSSIGKEILSVPKAQWQPLATKHQFQGVQTDFHHTYAHTFPCEDIGLRCDVRSQAAAFLVPWCCVEAYRHILNTIETLASDLELDYQLLAGSALGAVKLGNFIPWDIDMDVNFCAKDFHHFRSGGKAHKFLKDAGMSLYHFREDCYNIIGAGMFFMKYRGIMVEMLGRHQPMSRELLPLHLRHAPTRVKVGPDTWTRVPVHPGLNIRGRYGSGYLYHVQSWRFVEGMKDSGATYRPGAWQPCTQPGHHACLNNYPIQGNMMLLPELYP